MNNTNISINTNIKKQDINKNIEKQDINIPMKTNFLFEVPFVCPACAYLMKFSNRCPNCGQLLDYGIDWKYKCENK